MIYLDSASTTKVSPEVLDAMIPYLTVNYGNPNSLHKLGRKARNAVDASRKYVAELFRCDSENIIFTSGGCEANSMIFYGLKNRLKKSEKTQILVSAVEHASVLNAASQLEKDGFNIFYLPVDNNGAISFSSVKNAITDETGLISVMAVNNETGALNDVIEIGKLCEEQNILFHVDCVQAYGFISKYKIPCDFASISSHKIHGAKGCGALYMKMPICANEADFNPLIGGSESQEFGIRGGTENVAGIVGLGIACKELLKEDVDCAAMIKGKFYEELYGQMKNRGIEDAMNINGISSQYSAIINIMFRGVDNETLLLLLETNGVMASAGSACHNSQSRPSHVLKAMGLTDEESRSSIRFSFSKYNTIDEVKCAAKIVADSVEKLLMIQK